MHASLHLPKSGNGHCLIVELTLALSRRGGAYLAVRIETDNRRLCSYPFLYRLDFILDTLLEHELSANTADQDGKLRLPVSQRLNTHTGRSGRAIHQTVEEIARASGRER